MYLLSKWFGQTARQLSQNLPKYGAIESYSKPGIVVKHCGAPGSASVARIWRADRRRVCTLICRLRVPVSNCQLRPELSPSPTACPRTDSEPTAIALRSPKSPIRCPPHARTHTPAVPPCPHATHWPPGPRKKCHPRASPVPCPAPSNPADGPSLTHGCAISPH